MINQRIQKTLKINIFSFWVQGIPGSDWVTWSQGEFNEPQKKKGSLELYLMVTKFLKSLPKS